MNRWINRVAVVTGASAGIGAACFKSLVAKGMVVVGLDLHDYGPKKLIDSLPSDQATRFHYRQCDVANEQQVIDTFSWIDKTLGGADVLINNAGIARKCDLTDEGNSKDLRDILNVNVLSVCWCTREVFRSMQRRKVDDGHVIIMNSICGHKVPNVPGFSFNMYAPSKHACTALTEVYRKEFLTKGTRTKITSISPGVVSNDFFVESSHEIKAHLPMLTSAEIADAVTYCLETPPNVQIHEMIMKPLGETA